MASSLFTRRQILTYATTLAAGLPLIACSSSAAPSPKDSASATSSAPKIFRFANAAATASLDVGRTNTLETRRISQQILDTLVQPHPDTHSPQAALAESWEIDSAGTKITFTLRQGVIFHDGTAFTAEAVLENTKRWQLLAQQTANIATYPYQTLFSEIGSTQKALVLKVEAEENTVIFTLSRSSSLFLQALSQPAFGLVTPGSWNDKGYLLDTPIGTGPFSLSSWENQTAHLLTHDKYWGDTPQIDGITFTALSTAEKRYYALMNNEIDAYDQVDKNDFVPLAKEGIITQSRDPFALVYLDLNISHPVLSNVFIRRAISHALDRNQLTGSFFPQGSYSTQSFIPRSLQISDDDLAKFFSYAADIAQALVERSGYKNEPITFYYPTGTNLTAIPHPEALYANVAASLTHIGLNIVPCPLEYQDSYYDKISESDENRGISLMECFGAYRDPSAFLEYVAGKLPTGFFDSQISHQELKTVQDSKATATPSPSASPTQNDTSQVKIPEVDAMSLEADFPAQLLRATISADTSASTEEMRANYLDALVLWCQLMPAVPLVFSVSSLAQRGEVLSLPISISGTSRFNQVKME